MTAADFNPGFLTLADLPPSQLAGRRLLIRADLNVPLQDGRITDATRIEASLPTFRAALAAGAGVLVISHLGRPTEGKVDEALSLEPVARVVAQALEIPEHFSRDWIDGLDMPPGTLSVGENVRFLVGEKANDDQLARRMANLCDVFVMDAFGAAHRAHASTCGVIRHAPTAVAGPLLAAELDALGRALANPRRPLVAVVGGAKVSTKLQLLENLLQRVDVLIVGGGITNTFLAAKGYPVGKSLYEPEMVATARQLLAQAQAQGKRILLPDHVVCARELSKDAVAIERPVAQVADDELILDVGSGFARELAALLKAAGTIVWNGPLGVFELPPFAQGTQMLAQAIAASPAYSIAGGGDTLAAINQFGVAQQISYISTGGGAFLEFLEGRKLPAVEALRERFSAAATQPSAGG